RLHQKKIMADSTPLLNSSDSADFDPSSKQPLSLDETIEQCMGGFGFAQLIQVLLVAFAWVFDCQQNFINIFTDAEPKWHCTQLGSEPCSSATDICHLPDHAWSWDDPAHTTIISEWSLQCENSFIKGLPASSYFLGCVLGGLFLATLADSSLGRKNLLLLSCLLVSFSSLSIAFTNNIWIYALLRLTSGVGRATVGSTSLVLSTEVVGKRWRGQVGVVCSIFAMLGFLTIPGIGYLNRGNSWRTLYLWVSIPTIPYCVLVFFIVNESPRWLFVQGRKEEAISTLKSISPTNDKTKNLIMALSTTATLEQESRNVDTFAAFRILFQRKWAFRRLSILLFMVCGIGTVYYGMPLSLGNLSFNLYLSVSLNALAEVPSSIVASLIVDSILCVVKGKVFTRIQIGLELVAFFSSCTAFILAHIYSIELFPTSVRNSVLSLTRQSIVFGGMFSPVLVAAGRRNDFLSYGIFGLVPPSLDETIEQCIGELGLAQLFQAILVSFAWFFDSQQTFISVFTDAEPKWHCTYLPDSQACNAAVSDICQLPSNSWAWNEPIHTSIISEWGLQCASSLVKGLPASSFFIGCLVGGLVLATLADSTLGRKNMLVLSCTMMSFSGIVTVFSNNIWIYSALKFVNGLGRATIGTSALVLSTELVGKRWRGQVGVIGFFCFTLGFLSLPIIAYVNRDSSWRTIYLWTSVPTIFYAMLVHFFVRESPRWLFVRGRKEEAVSILRSIAPATNGGLTMSFSNLMFEQESWNVDTYSALKILLHKKWACRRLCLVMAMVFGIGMVYYGMPLGLGNLSFNIYLSVTFNALAELPTSVVTFFLIDRLNRKDSVLVSCVLSGVCSILCVLVGKVSPNLQIGLELVSFFGSCAAFNISLIYVLELFPTCVRNSAISMARQSLVFGGIFSPVLVAAARSNNGFLSYGVFGLVIGFCGLFALMLPETRGKPICDTMDEEEHRQRSISCHGPANNACLA
ncbi:hypothetical protein Tsubulata_041042, partial [Turnera subulata]